MEEGKSGIVDECQSGLACWCVGVLECWCIGVCVCGRVEEWKNERVGEWKGGEVGEWKGGFGKNPKVPESKRSRIQKSNVWICDTVEYASAGAEMLRDLTLLARRHIRILFRSPIPLIRRLVLQIKNLSNLYGLLRMRSLWFAENANFIQSLEVHFRLYNLFC